MRQLWPEARRVVRGAAGVVTVLCVVSSSLVLFPTPLEARSPRRDSTEQASTSVGPAGPVITFLGDRFAVCRGPEGFASAAFDPVNERFASQRSIRNLCGGFISEGPDEQPGLAWDSVTGTYWQVTGDRVVRRWNTATLLDTVFTVPLTFTVPGSGPDTLESVRGIAVDASHVYLVDAGPDPGEIESNAWFKFTRAGAVVKSSKSTDVLDHLELDPDALFDDIVYVPESSPVAPGLFLIALEHSGIQVVDAEGDFVAKFRWSTQDLPGGVTLAAFAGLTIDPARGNLYLVDNDRGLAQVWVRLQPDDTGFVLGTGSIEAFLQRPNAACNMPLWRDFSPGMGNAPSGIFGIAYRSIDARVYGFDFTSADFWAFSPLSGEAALIGSGGPPSTWGLAYDSERDVFYAGEETATDILLHVVDPADGSTTALPSHTGFYFSDCAFNPLDARVYAVSLNAPAPTLIRIDRDTGVGSTIGPSVPARGLTWDPSTERLIGITNNPSVLHSIDPATGVATVLDTLATNSGWEGLAAVTLPSAAVGVESIAAVGDDEPHVRAFPNPAPGPTTVAFALARPSNVTLRVFDVRGRLVRELPVGPLAAGDHRLHWDGRDDTGTRVANGVYFVRVEGATGRAGRVVQLR